MKRNIESLRVLAYHTVFDSCNFEKQLVYLKENYSIISIEQLSLFLSEKTESPKNPMLITFDDEDISVCENALTFLKKNKELFKKDPEMSFNYNSIAAVMELRTGRAYEARKYLKITININPLQVKSYVRYIISYLPFLINKFCPNNK